MKKPLFLASTLFTVVFSFHAFAMPEGDASKGELKTPSCRFCHGVDGIAPRPAYPNLKGQHAQYLYDSMQAYKNGQRTDGMSSMMKDQLRNLTDQDIADIAKYYEQLGK
ncbi:c-type cytochrome [Photobacterium damselae]|uniref:Cytochrome C554 n=1 Tax=Photobacterium damselae TaxID=38293 RepID=A0ABD6X4R9_PHODM|nr:cytochrome c [Photobacterium damselae]OBU44396.1 cytochrome C554 [Photobacterium damselae]PSU17485.1 cytochrome C554 [Photobacterium damselae]